MITYSNRTPESIKDEYNEYTNEGVLRLAFFLDCWMSNMHNGRTFKKLADEMIKNKVPANEIAKVLFNHGSDWFSFGN